MRPSSKLFIFLFILFTGVNRPWAGDDSYRFANPPTTTWKDIKRPPWIGAEGIRPGWDFTLPPWVQPSANGWTKYSPDKKLSFVGKRLKEVEFAWKDLEPKRDQFVWDQLRQAIIDVGAEGFGVELHIKGAVWEMRKLKKGTSSKNPKWDVKVGTAPRWLRDQYHIPIVEEKPTWNVKSPFQVVNLDIFNRDYHARYLKLLSELRRSGIPQMQEIAIVYIHGKSSSKGEEGQLPNDGVAASLFEERLDSWALAFHDKVDRLVFVGNWGRLLDHAYQLGMGQRSGFVEQYLGSVTNTDLCQDLRSDGHLMTLEDCPPMRDDRAFGDENEEYDKSWAARFGPFASFPHRYRESMLRMLQMRRNLLWTSPFSFDPDLLSYVSLSLGKKVSDTPDVWAYLRESYIEGKKDNGKVPVPVKNFERWLYQRDREGSRTVPTARVDVPVQMKDHHPQALYDYIARRTDSKNGQRAMSFAVDDRFLSGGPHPVTIKVTYHDVGESEWKILIPGVNGICQQNNKNENSRQLRTLTMRCEQALFEGQDEDEDFRIEVDKGDVIVSFVRIIRDP